MEIKGKCYSKVNRGQRKKSDLYQTPYSITRELLKREKFKGPILEPACGLDAIVNVLNEYKYNVHSYDIIYGVNFLDEKNKYESIITNPPFSIANGFIEKCLEICTDKFALLLPLNYLQGQYRFEKIYTNDSNLKLSKIYIFTRMPTLDSIIRKDGLIEKTGMQSLAWYVWENGYCGNPIVDWIDCKDIICRKGEII